MRSAYHRLARIGVFVAGAAVVAAVLVREPPRPSPPPIRITLAVAPPPHALPAEPLFAAPTIDALPARAGGPPRLMGIVGRVSAPLAMIRLEDGAVRTLAAGEAAGGWTLERVAADRAVFRRGGEMRVSVLPPR